MTIHDQPVALASVDLIADLLDALGTTVDDWRHHAECRTADPELFWPLSASDTETITTAITRYCNRCTVKAECGAYADEHKEPGVWGGALRYLSAGRYTVATLCAERGCFELVRQPRAYCRAHTAAAEPVGAAA
jgi:WhiB family transcriptional regulator, redox-sensing transcriptional regulator